MTVRGGSDVSGGAETVPAASVRETVEQGDSVDALVKLLDVRRLQKSCASGSAAASVMGAAVVLAMADAAHRHGRVGEARAAAPQTADTGSAAVSAAHVADAWKMSTLLHLLAEDEDTAESLWRHGLDALKLGHHALVTGAERTPWQSLVSELAALAECEEGPERSMASKLRDVCMI